MEGRVINTKNGVNVYGLDNKLVCKVTKGDENTPIIIRDSNDDIIAISSKYIKKEETKKKINWKHVLSEMAWLMLGVAMELLFIAYIFHRLGCF